VGGVEIAPETGFGAAAVGRDRRQGDGDGAGGQVGRWEESGAGGIQGHGEDDGALQGEAHGLAVVAALAQGEASAGGETAEGGGEAAGQGGEVIEGQDAVVEGQGEELMVGRGERGERAGGGVNERTEEAGGGGLAAGGRSLEDEEGVGAGGAEGGEEPGEDAAPVLGAREVEEGAERFEGGGDFGGGSGGRIGGAREWQDASAAAETNVGEGSDLPAVGGDFDDLAAVVGEVEGEGGGAMGVAAGGDAEVKGVDGTGVVGASFDGAEDTAEGAVAGRELGFREVGREEPVAEA